MLRILLVLSLIVAVCGCTAPRMTAPENARMYYPNASRRLGETGRIVLRFSIGPDGKVSGPILHDDPVIVDLGRSQDREGPARRLIEAAERYISKATFDVRGVHKRHLVASVVFEMEPCGKVKDRRTYDYAILICGEQPPHVDAVTP